MIYKSRQVNLDPEPHVRPDGSRWPEPWKDEPEFFEYAPRPEFEPTRDPEPWMCHELPNHGPFETRTCDRCYWAPRREQFDTPVNRVLVAFREDCADPDFEVNSIVYYAQSWLNNTLGIDVDWDTFDLDEIDHARRVLTRLANWKEQ